MNRATIYLLAMLMPGGLLAVPAAAQAPAAALEHEAVTVSTSEGLRLAGWASRPRAKTTPLPALFFVQWVSCGTIAPGKGDPGQVEALARAAGYAVLRIDRSGTGASEGSGCDRLDYDTELRHYREAFDALARHRWVDPKRIVIYGSSLGATIAPQVAAGKPVAGVVVQGGGALTYYERMLAFDRLQLQRQQSFDATAIDAEMRRRARFQQFYLLDRMLPEAIEAAHPELRGVWASLLGTDEEPPHYGRPHAWHWQAARRDFLAAWARVDAPVMVVYSEFDQYEMREGHRAIVETVERLRPGTTRWLELAGADHGLEFYPNRIAAYSGAGGRSNPQRFVTPVAAWLREVAAPR